MTEVELLNKAEKFLKKYERIIWKPFDFPRGYDGGKYG